MNFVHKETLSEGLRYTETLRNNARDDAPNEVPPFMSGQRRLPFRQCELWADGEDKPVSSLRMLPYRCRFGAAALPVEGYADVITPPRHRRKGYVGRLMRKSIERAATRVDVLFLDGIERLYEKYGFACCWLNSDIRVLTRHAETAESMDGVSLRPIDENDVERIVALFNSTHAARSCTRERTPETCRGPYLPEIWDPGHVGLLLERSGEMLGYTFYRGDTYGSNEPLTVVETVAVDVAAANTLVRHVAERGIQKRIDTISFREAPDSLVGLVLRNLGCEVRMVYQHHGGGMGLICNRSSFVDALTDEFTRRAGMHDEAAIKLLAEGHVYPDKILMPLMTGFQSWRDASRGGWPLPTGHEELMKRWFPGSGPDMETPIMCYMDHY